MPFCKKCGIELPTPTEHCPVCAPVKINANAATAPPRPEKEPSLVPSLDDAPNMLDAFSWSSPTGHHASASAVAADRESQPRPQAASKDATLEKPAPGILAALNDPVLRPRILRAAILALTRSLALSALVFIPGLLLLAVLPLAGLAWMFFGSFLLMVRTYAKPWRLMWITCLTPAIASGLCFLIQLAVFYDRIPPIILLVPGAAVGCGIGLLRARSHSLYLEKGAVMAKRTVGYLIIWAICYGMTQLLGLFAHTMPLVKGGLATSMFSTCMLICVSLVILTRYLKLQRASHESGSYGRLQPGQMDLRAAR